MDRVIQTGNKIAKIQKESRQNSRRKSENFVQPDANVGSVDALRPYRFSFSSTPRSSIFLNLAIKEDIVTCTMSPPPIDVSCVAQVSGDATAIGGAGITSIISTTSNVDPGQPDFFIKEVYNIVDEVGTLRKFYGVAVPLDGCYNIKWESAYWGVSYFSVGTVNVNLYHSYMHQEDYHWQDPNSAFSIEPLAMSGTANSSTYTGVIIILGPTIYVYGSPSPIWGITEARSDDLIWANIKATNTDWGPYRTPYGWPNGGLYGEYWPQGATVTITLTAIADLPKRPEDAPAYGLEPSNQGILRGFIKGYHLTEDVDPLSPYYTSTYQGPIDGASIITGEWNALIPDNVIAVSDVTGYYEVTLEAGVYTLTAHKYYEDYEDHWTGWPPTTLTARIYPGRVTVADFPLNIIVGS